MTTASTFLAAAYETGEYLRPRDADMIGANGRKIASSNWDEDGNTVSSGWPFSPTDFWEFPDGSTLKVGYSATDAL